MHVFPSNGSSSRAPEVVGAQPSGREPREGERDAFTDAPEALESWLSECLDIERQVRAWLEQERRLGGEPHARERAREDLDRSGSS